MSDPNEKDTRDVEVYLSQRGLEDPTLMLIAQNALRTSVDSDKKESQTQAYEDSGLENYPY